MPFVDNGKFLGLVINRLHWRDHISDLSKNICSSLYVLYRLRNITTLPAMKSYYHAYVEARLRYGIVFWGSSVDFAHLFILQKRVIRSMCRLPPLESCREHFRELRILPLPCLYIYELIVFVKQNKALFVTNNCHFNAMTTRNCNDYSIPKHKTTMITLQ
jgi:hypothetical protein